jgi:hypothetical protein
MHGQALSFVNFSVILSVNSTRFTIIEDEDAALVSGVSHGNNPAIIAPASPLTSPPPTPSDLNKISGWLDSLSHLVECLLPSAPIKAPVDPPPPAHTSDNHTRDVLSGDSPSIRLLSTMSQDDFIWPVHHKEIVLPSVHPCDTAKSCDKKTHWMTKELHRAMKYRKFCNYKHLLQVSPDGTWVDGGKFPLSLGSFATIPKSNQGKPFEQVQS